MVSSTTWKKFAIGLAGLSVGASIWCVSAGAQNQKAPDIVVTLLGTGSPIPEPGRVAPALPHDRMNAMTLVRAGQEVLLFDVGRGVVERLSQAGVKGREITSIFLTHFHSDHIVGLPDLWLTSRLTLSWGGRTEPMEVIGPTGTKDLVDNLVRAYAPDIAARPDQPQIDLVGRDFDKDGVVFDRNGVRVTAFTVDHGPAKPAVGYRIDFNGRSVLISGDTRLNQNVIKYGAGVRSPSSRSSRREPRSLTESPEAHGDIRSAYVPGAMRRGFCPGQAEARSLHPHRADGRAGIRRALPSADGAGDDRRDEKGLSRPSRIRG